MKNTPAAAPSTCPAELRALQEKLEAHSHKLASALGQAAAEARRVKEVLDELKERKVTVEQLQVGTPVLFPVFFSTMRLGRLWLAAGWHSVGSSAA